MVTEVICTNHRRVEVTSSIPYFACEISITSGTFWSSVHSYLKITSAGQMRQDGRIDLFRGILSIRCMHAMRLLRRAFIEFEMNYIMRYSSMVSKKETWKRTVRSDGVLMELKMIDEIKEIKLLQQCFTNAFSVSGQFDVSFLIDRSHGRSLSVVIRWGIGSRCTVRRGWCT